MVSELRKSGISVVGDVSWGTHFCHFYETKQDLLDTLVPYFKAGLESKEFCLWVVSNSELITVEEAKAALALAVPDLDRHLSEKNIEILNGHDWYFERNVLALERVRSAWDAKLKRALARGYDGLRASADTFWLAEKDLKDFFEYEKQVNDWITNQCMTVMCTYPLARSGAAEVLDVVQAHQFAIARRQGEWEVIETPELIQDKAEIGRLNEDLEQRVVERTSELRLANEELRKEMIERKQAEEALDERLRFETLVTELSAAFASLSPNEVDREIDKWLQTLVEFLGVDRASFFQFREDSTTLYLGHSYTVPGIEPLSLPPIGIDEQFPWITHQLRRGNTIKWSRIPDDLPEQAANEKKHAATTGAKSVLNIPVLVGGSVICTISFTSIGIYCDWPDATVARLRLVGEIFAAAVERKRAEEALREAEQKYRDIFENAGEGIFQSTPDGKYIVANPALARMYGFASPEALIHSRWDISRQVYVDPTRREEFKHRLEDQGVVLGFEHEVFRKDGSKIWISVNARAVREEQGAIRYYEGTAQDVTERKHAEEKLKATSEQLLALSARLQSAREEEGARIAREIHDELGSALTALRWGLDEIRGMLSTANPESEIDKVKEKLTTFTSLIDTTFEIVRRVSSELRPSVVDEAGLVAAIVWAAKGFEDRTGIVCHFETSVEDVHVNREQSTAIFRIFQEALTNILRHAEAIRVEITIKEATDEFVMTITDNGKGITKQQQSGAETLGLIGMRERAHLIGGKVNISSGQARGTVVTVRVPIATSR